MKVRTELEKKAHRDYMRVWWARQPQDKIDARNAQVKIYKQLNPEKYKLYALNRKRNKGARKAEWRKLRIECLEAYGGQVCSCCGETTYEFLTIDHINNDGAAHRKSLKTNSIYNWLKKNNFPPGFRVLCYNCNCARGHYGQCPHESNMPGVGVDTNISHVPNLLMN